MENKSASLKWIYNNSKKHITGICLLSFLLMCNSIFSVYLAPLSKKIIDIATNQAEGTLFYQGVTLASVLFIQLLIQIAVAYLNVRIVGKISINFKENLFSTLLNKDLRTVSQYHSGELLNRITSDVSIVTNGIVNILPNLIAFLTSIIVASCVLFSLNKEFAILMLIIGPSIMFIARIYSKKMKSLHKQCQETDGKTRSFMQEALQNILVVKSFSNEDAVVKSSTLLQNTNYNLTIKRNNISIIANICFYLGLTAGYYFALAYGAYKISQGVMTVGSLVAILQLVSHIQSPFKNISSLLPQYYSTIASAERIMELFNLKNEIIIQDNKINSNDLYNSMQYIKFKNVSFSYDNEIIFSDTDLIINKGDFIAITGSSGIGKSTILKLLLGIISPSSGEISFATKDNRNILVGKNTRDMFAYVPQGNMILSGTIRDNITFYKQNTIEDEIIKASKIAEIWEFINTLPDGLDTIIGENGLGLSEGQIQRIAIARALLHDNPILLLDEATSALDENTEELVLRNIKELSFKSCIIVSHKKAAVDCCNKQVYIENGKIFSI